MKEPLSRAGPHRDDPVEAAIIELARANPELGQARVSAELTKRGLTISPSGVRHIWQRHDLETAFKRIKAISLKGKGAREKLTERQARLLERGKVGERGVRRQRRQLTIPNDTLFDRRMQILSAAADHFSKDGYARSSLRDISGKIGLLPGSIYHHFRTKDDLFLSVHRQGLAQLIENVSSAVAARQDPWERLEVACCEHIKALVAGDSILRLTGASFFSSYEPKMNLRLKPDRDRYEAIYKGVVNELDLQPPVDRTLFRLGVLGAINWTHIWYREGRLTPEDIARQLVSMWRPAARKRRSADVDRLE